jgi:transcriptional regulator with PAS, ATPase and Fis domain
LNSSVNWRRGRRVDLSAIGRDIVFPSGKMSTESDHAQLVGLSAYHWPGNVRELQNVIAALAVAAPRRGRLSADLLPAAISGAMPIGTTRLADARLIFERRFVAVALARAGGNRARAARALGLSRQGLLKLIERLRLDGA